MQDKKQQLFILPYAGGSMAAFKKLTDCIDISVETITVEYAGRGTRSKEPLADNFWALFDDSVEYILKRRDINLPYSLMGYSMGSVIAYEILARKKVPGELKHLFIAAEVSPKERALELRKVKDPSDDCILERAKRLGGLDKKMIDNKRFREIYIKPMLSDYKLFYEYRFENHNEKIQQNTTFFYCETDTEKREIDRWNELIEGRFDFHEFGENHFFINQYYQPMASVINSHLCGSNQGNENDV